ncbi:hypothetical protein SAMN04487951_13110 [Vreelandella arcis]|uniref:Uncharacterized protein n=1 Tax=Vreelandella arcis TaxID=416873 RepID=A0A1H0JQP9_9GAMM|nr:hypothetical protein SAMN04487951_13110 [Halomonas arcis]
MLVGSLIARQVELLRGSVRARGFVGTQFIGRSGGCLLINRELVAYRGGFGFYFGFYGAGVVAFGEHVEDVADPAG